MTNQRINNTEIWSKRNLLYQTAADLFIGFFLKKPTCFFFIGENEVCGDGDTTLVSGTGVITSLDQDKNGLYDNHLDCHWTVQLDFDSVIIFEVRMIDIYKQSADCLGDFLEV